MRSEYNIGELHPRVNPFIKRPLDNIAAVQFVAVKDDTKSIFLAMYRNYIQALTQYSDYLASHPQTDDDIRENYLEDDLLQSYFVCAGDQNVGFIILQYIDEKYEVNPPMWYIVEFYIAPEYRGRGYGTKAVERFLHEFSGGFFYYILRKNMPAKEFWSAVTARFHLREVERLDISCGDISELELHCFERSDD